MESQPHFHNETIKRRPELWRRSMGDVRAAVTGLNFIQLHYVYFIGTTLVASAIFWASSTPSKSITYTNALFLCVSAMTEAGLNTINLSTLNTWQQVMLFLLIIMGSAIFVSAFVVQVRLRAFEDRFVDEIDRERRSRRRKTLEPLRQSLSRMRSRSRTFSRGSATQAHEEAFKAAIQDPASNRTGHSSIEIERGQEPNSTYDNIATIQTTTKPAGSGRSESNGLDVSDLPPTSTSMPELTRGDSAAIESTTDVQSMRDLATTISDRNRISFAPETRLARFSNDASRPAQFLGQLFLPSSGVGARPVSLVRSRSRASHAATEVRSTGSVELKSQGADAGHRPFKTGILSRNSTFHHMDENDRERLGGLEYKAVRLLAWLVPLYFVLWQLLGAIALGAWVTVNRPAVAVMNGINPFWMGAFNAVSAFNNSGMSLLDANMVAFQTSAFMLISMGLFILAGNTCYPIFLRLIVWTMWRLMPAHNKKWTDFGLVCRFLLDHPRRVYTNLFPSRETWWLFAVVVVLNGVDCAFFSILNIGNKAITHLDPGFEFLDGLFQAFAVRSGGFYVVPIPSTRISLQILYVVMMYISVYPVVITMRNSNIYEERSLGIYAGDAGYDDYDKQHKPRRTNFLALLGHGSSKTSLPRRPSDAQEERGWAQRTYFIQQQLRAQLAHDIWWLVLAIWLIMIVEGGNFERDPTTFSVFNVIFEIVSAYGTVGISVGVPYDAYSFCGAWHKVSKLILCAVMLRGRHRGLPVAIDKAIMLPRDSREQADWEEEDARHRFQRAKTMDRTEDEVDKV